MRGQPTKLTYQMIDALEAELALGLPYRIVCALVGISYQTFRNWQNGKFPERTSERMQRYYFDRIEKAEAKAFKHLYLQVKEAAEDKQIQKADKKSSTWTRQGTWVAAAWILERRYPEYFAKRTEITGAGGSPLALEAMVNKAAESHGIDKADLMAEAARLLEGVEDE